MIALRVIIAPRMNARRDDDARAAAMRRAAIGTAIFVLLVPGTVVGFVPYVLTGWRIGPPLGGWSVLRWVGVALLIAGLPVFVSFIGGFVREGLGTPAPIAPPRHLVVGGVFRYVRNPGYVAVLAMLLGQGLLFGSRAMLVYAAVMALGFHVFVVLYEEPTLRQQFGAEYDEYSAAVPRWIPRLR